MSPILFRRLKREFASTKTNAVEKYGEDLEEEKKEKKNRGEWKRKLGQGRNDGSD